MATRSGFTAYPSKPDAIGETIRRAVELNNRERGTPHIHHWEESDIAGRFLITPILANINGSDFLAADITVINFNVVFEIGYAIGRGKRCILIQNEALSGSEEIVRQVGIFDTLGHVPYTNSEQLKDILGGIGDFEGLPIDETINTKAPIYLVLPRLKTDVEIRIQSRLKKARQPFRTYDPEEIGRLSAGDAIDNVAQSHGVLIPLLSRHRQDAEVHNVRAAFIAGLAFALERELLLLQQGEDPVPLDYRDLVASFQSLDQIHEYVSDFSLAVGSRFTRSAPPIGPEPKTLLAKLNLGASAAENEFGDLGHYYLETDEYRRALRGEVRVVTGRKGAGKTALFVHLRDRLRRQRKLIVLDLKPEGFQLLKFKERVLDYLEEGTKEHTITAFWEYLLLLETCHKLLQNDRQAHMRDQVLYDLYRGLEERYRVDAELVEGDFSERMIKLTERIADDFQFAYGASLGQKHLARAEITELLYRHDLAALRDAAVTYLSHKEGLWILFDNLDKGWPAHGVTPEDVLTLRSLIEAVGKLERDLSRRGIDSHGVVFIRNDVYELLVANTADRGKVPSISLDWTDENLLREMLRRRFLFTDDAIPQDTKFEDIWSEIVVSHVDGEESSQYLIDRSLMRPRALIDLLRYCRSQAVNIGNTRIEANNILQGEEHYSTNLLENIEFEISDVFPAAGDILWEFFGSGEVQTVDEIRSMIGKVAGESTDRLFQLLLWYGFLGVIRDNGDTAYVYNVSYEMKRLSALIQRTGGERARLRINPAFWKALEIRRTTE